MYIIKKYILIIVVFSLVLVGVFSYPEYKKRTDFKNEVEEYLTKQGYASEEYATPEYVEREILKGHRVENIEINFNEEKNYNYYYARTADGIELSTVINKENRERDYDKKEPLQ